MTLLLPANQIPERRAVARGALSPLADSLTADLGPLLMDGFTIPREKARLSRTGGRCPNDAALLEFDPFSPRAHRCPRCGRVYDDEAHYRWWVMGYQLWIAERAVHGALLRLLRNDVAAGQLAESILDVYTDNYLTYPNSDNVLGPTRLFFSTYLESIWLLQICVAIDLLEAAGAQRERGARVRERIIEPSSALIRAYDEGASNRQVWNNAALLASSTLLGSYPAAEALVWGPSGLVAHLARGLLADGTWYEGENYHLFAHRGLWYGMHIAERLEVGLGEPFVAPFVARFDAGFAASFVTALPDLTLPSRRDSQYAISTRQWRFAELCELGLLRQEDARLRGMLGRLYAADIPRAASGRAQSTAEVERNLPPTALTRADLGWRSLLLAHADLPAAAPEPPQSILLEGQGLAILRRDGGSLYLALDYGHSGGGHGHPDRLNVQLVHGPVRWLDDMGTGSYVDPSLHWYRSTLAHNAPFVRGRSQERVNGELDAFEESREFGWVHASVAGFGPGASATRALVASAGYAIDVLRWSITPGETLDLPLHLDADASGTRAWTASPLEGAGGLEDGFGFLSDTAVTPGDPTTPFLLAGSRDGRAIATWTSVDVEHEWWRATGPGAPGAPAARFYLMRSRSPRGMVRTVLDWSRTVRDVRFADTLIIVECTDGSRHSHSWNGTQWEIDVASEGRSERINLGGTRERTQPAAAPARSGDDALARRAHVIPRVGNREDAGRRAFTMAMGEQHYRRSELPWSEAGQPTATVRLAATKTSLSIDVEVRKREPVTFAPARARNELDNEDPDINSDGVQLHLASPSSDGPILTWLLVPVPGGSDVRVKSPADAPSLRASWAPSPHGYLVRCEIELTGVLAVDRFDLDVIVNEISPDRERRRGQLVLSGGRGEWIYLRGDRQPRPHLLHFVIEDRGR